MAMLLEQEFQVPEIKRSSLEDLCLSAKLAAPDSSIADFLLQAIEPPETSAVAAGVATLESIGALAPDETPTPLGRLLETLPLDPLSGNLVLLGALFGCLDPILTIACVGAYQCDPALSACQFAAASAYIAGMHALPSTTQPPSRDRHDSM